MMGGLSTHDTTRDERGAGPHIVELAPPSGLDWSLREHESRRRVVANLFGRDLTLRVSRYELGRRLGAGARGVVYEAWDPKLARHVAIKLVPAPTDAPGDGDQGRMLREGQAMAKVSHENVLPIFDVGTFHRVTGAVGSGIFIVMPLVEGRTLRAWMDDRARPWREVGPVFLAAAAGLAAAHDAGLVHSDFKPANVMIDELGRVRVLDFGIARPRATFATTTEESFTAMRDETLTVAGTPAYMAPEQHCGGAADPRSDQYAFCVALFEALAGARPFPQRSFAELLAAKQTAALPASPRAPARVLAALRRGLDPDPARRYDDMHALLRVLGRERRVSKGGAALAIAGGVAVAVSYAAWGGSDACSFERTRLRSHVPGELSRAILAVDDTGERTAQAEALERRIELYAGAWQAQRHETCVAAAVDEGALALRTECLDEAALAFAAVTDVLRRSDATTVRHADEIVDGLPKLDACADVETLALTAAGHDAVNRRLRVEVHGEWSRVRSLRLAGRVAEALTASERALELARQAEDPEAIVRSLYALGWALAALDRLDDAEARVREGWYLAEAEGNRALSLRGTIDLAGISFALGRLEEAERLVELADAKRPAAAAGPATYADLLYQRGRIELARGNARAAADFARDTVRLRSDVLGSDHVGVAWAAKLEGRALMAAGDPRGAAESLARAEAILRSAQGDSPEVAATWIELAAARNRLGGAPSQ